MSALREFRWIIRGATPETIPMARLAEYMQNLAKVLGEERFVHFDRIERGSVQLVAHVERPAITRVTSRVAAVRGGSAPTDAMRGYNQINTMLEEDRGTATLKRGSATIIRFRGVEERKPAGLEVQNAGYVSGYLYWLAESRNGITARIQPAAGNVVHCIAAREIGKRLRSHLFETVRVYGTGTWRRGHDGQWNVLNLEISDFKKVEGASLRRVIDKIRDLDVEWPDDPLGVLDDINERYG